MDFEWDENKRRKNIEKHDLDFLDADIFFEGLCLVKLAKSAGDEQRELATGMIGNVYVTTIFTRRGNVFRIISMRRARNGEREKHQELFGVRPEVASRQG